MSKEKFKIKKAIRDLKNLRKDVERELEKIKKAAK